MKIKYNVSVGIGLVMIPNGQTAELIAKLSMIGVVETTYDDKRKEYRIEIAFETWSAVEKALDVIYDGYGANSITIHPNDMDIEVIMSE